VKICIVKVGRTVKHKKYLLEIEFRGEREYSLCGTSCPDLFTVNEGIDRSFNV
jgi:hypothetical protein